MSLLYHGSPPLSIVFQIFLHKYSHVGQIAPCEVRISLGFWSIFMHKCMEYMNIQKNIQLPLHAPLPRCMKSGGIGILYTYLIYAKEEEAT